MYAGSITPVEPGRMRNYWFPKQKAEYVTAASLQGIKVQSLVAERDFTFGLESEEKTLDEDQPVEIQTNVLQVCSGSRASLLERSRSRD